MTEQAKNAVQRIKNFPQALMRKLRHLLEAPSNVTSFTYCESQQKTWEDKNKGKKNKQKSLEESSASMTWEARDNQSSVEVLAVFRSWD